MAANREVNMPVLGGPAATAETKPISEGAIRNDDEKSENSVDSAEFTDYGADNGSNSNGSAKQDNRSEASETDEEYYALQEKRIEKYGAETTKLLNELSDVMQESRNDFVFACGGSVPLMAADNSESLEQDEGERKSMSPSSTSSMVKIPAPADGQALSIRWDSHDASTPASRTKLSFPAHLEPSTSENVAQLLSDMAPASFGLVGKNIYDEGYRKALKLDTSQFSTNFCPYTLGIVDAIAQILLPEASKGKARGVKAELYKLNVYQGPKGFFRSHIDTPRSATQFGSLVICLPLPHGGGQLEVRHRDKTATFDWSGEPSDIQWAAFYSDCEHEVLEVTSGHRLTLTYNLLAVPDNEQHADSPVSALDLAQLPLYRHLEHMLDQKSFMTEGGWLGFYTTHAYVHSSTSFEVRTLKGLDTAIWQAFQALGCGVCLRPVIDVDIEDEETYHVSLQRVIGQHLPLKMVGDQIETHADMQCMLREWPMEKLKHADVEWLNEPREEKEMQVGYIAYGNYASTEFLYSRCAILVGVPPYGEDGRKRVAKTFEEREVEWSD